MEDFNGCPYSNVVALNDTLTILSGKWINCSNDSMGCCSSGICEECQYQ